MPTPRPSDALPRPPGDFADALATKEPVMLVGGQAVNLWALAYADRTKDLMPFTSRDADVLGDAKTLNELARLAGRKPQLFPIRNPTNELGVVVARDARGEPMLIEVLRYVKGPTNEELATPSYLMGLGPKEVKVKVPGPIALMKAKLANVIGISQDGRQDGRHIVILARVIPAYLSNLEASAREGRLSERMLIELLEMLVAIVTEKRNRKALNDFAVDPSALFVGLDPDGLPKLQAFLEKRLPRVLPPS